MENKIVTAQDEFNKMFGGKTGSDNQDSGLNFPYLIILQNDKQFKVFSDKEDMKLGALGSLFVRSKSGNKSTDLRKTLRGSLISEQKGFEFWYDNKFIDGMRGATVNAFEKEDMVNKIEEYDPQKGRPTNVVKLLIKLDEPYILANGETNEFVVITIKGTSWGYYLEQFIPQKQALVIESEELENLGIRKAVNTPVIYFHLEISTAVVKTQQGENYVFAIIPTLNSANKVKELYEDWKKALEYDLITNSIISKEPVAVKTITVDDAEMPVNDLEVDFDKLPFE